MKMADLNVGPRVLGFRRNDAKLLDLAGYEPVNEIAERLVVPSVPFASDWEPSA
jgi:hypothetical protein